MADAAHDQAAAWLADRIDWFDVGSYSGYDGALIGQHILDGCEVREEWGVRYGDNADFWTGSGGEQLARKAVDYATSAGRSATLIRRHVITTPATEHQ